MRDNYQHLKSDHIAIIIRITEKEKEYQTALISGKTFGELKKLRKIIHELRTN